VTAGSGEQLLGSSDGQCNMNSRDCRPSVRIFVTVAEDLKQERASKIITRKQNHIDHNGLLLY
jgi:hypothetical protein